MGDASMNTQITKTEAEMVILGQFEEVRPNLPGANTGWVEDLRQNAIDLFNENGLPHRRLEDWKYTDLRSLIAEALPFTRPQQADINADGAGYFTSLDRHVVVFVDGSFRPDISIVSDLPDGVELRSLANTMNEAPDWLEAHLGKGPAGTDNAVVAINTAFMADGAVLKVGKGVHVDRPIEFSFIHSGAERNTLALRNLVVVENGASVTLLESHINLADTTHITNIASDVVVEDGATLNHVKVQAENLATTHLSTLSANVGGHATFNSFTATHGASVSRNQIAVRFNGEETNANISGGYMIAGDQHCDTTLFVDHAVPGCNSTELFKGVIDGDAHGVFQGKIIVKPDAQKVDARMMTKGLLLSESAQFTAKPELEIFADDVQCAHGATSGELDEEMMFYLRSRGVPAHEAKALLIAAFVAETFEQIEDEAIREALQDLPARWLDEHKGNSDA